MLYLCATFISIINYDFLRQSDHNHSTYYNLGQPLSGVILVISKNMEMLQKKLQITSSQPELYSRELRHIIELLWENCTKVVMTN